MAQLDCQYPFNRSRHVPASLAPQPSPSLLVAPDGVTPSNTDLELFSTFCNSTVKISSGPFNQHFWQVDVPRAAARHPALWHAGIALAAINLSINNINVGATTNCKNYSASRHGAPQNAQYVQALTHYNKSIQHLRRSIATSDSDSDNKSSLTYADKEMAIMTNILYVGIAGVLEDDAQRVSHSHNLLRLLESVRFGDDDPRQRRGSIMAHDALLSLVFGLEGSTSGITPRGNRAWAVKVPPSRGPFTSVTQAYLAFLPLVHQKLQDEDKLSGCTGDMAKFLTYLGEVKRFEQNLSDLDGSKLAWSKDDAESLAIMGQHVKLIKIRRQSVLATTRADFMRHDERFMHELERIEDLLSKEPPGCRAPAYVPGQPYLYSVSHGSLLEHIVTYTHNAAIRRRGIEMMRKWPYKENGMCGPENARFYETFIQHELSGPARTRESQLAGNAVIPKYRNGGLKGRAFDGMRECECLYALYVCRDHRVAMFDTAADLDSHSLASAYELRHDIPPTRYYV